MKRIKKRSSFLLLPVCFFFLALLFLSWTFISNASRWSTHRANGHLYQSEIKLGRILDRNRAVLVQNDGTSRKFLGDSVTRKATLHAVGDPPGYIATGAHVLFRARLAGYRAWTGVFRAAQNTNTSGFDVVLSIDAGLCRRAWQALDGRKGAIGVMDTRTGALLCMVSSPSFDPTQKPKNIEDNPKFDAVYLNRLLSGQFPPGSTFKVITLAAALQNLPAVESRSFTCSGKYKTTTGAITCRQAHGKLGLQRALNVSCNSVFAELAIELGAEKLRKTAQMMGFGATCFAETFALATSQFPAGALDPLALGWAGIGQDKVLANPGQMLLLMSAIANGGHSPKLRLREHLFPAQETNIAIPKQLAQTLQEYLRSNVTNIYDTSGKKTGDLGFSGKTGTAEVDGKAPHAWFVGFTQSQTNPLAIVVVVENGGSGQAVAFEIAAKLI